jgi:aldose 1-epimerase
MSALTLPGCHGSHPAIGTGRIGGALMMSVQEFGEVNGTPVFEIVIASKAGASAKIITWGASVRDLIVPSRPGPQRVVLGLNTLADYQAYASHMGAIAGRFANRIAGGKFTLDGVG